MSEKKKIWIFNHYASDMYINHGGRHFYFAKYLIKKGYDVKIFCANTFHNKKDVVKVENKKYAKKELDKINFIFVKTIPAIGNGIKRILNMLIFYINIFSVAKDMKKEWTPDIILASSVHPLTLVAGIKIAKKYQIPCICEVRDLWPEAIFNYGKVKEKSILGKLLMCGEHWIYKHADAIIFTKPGDIDYLKEKKWLSSYGGDISKNKCHYINNGVDLESYRKLEKNYILNDEDLNNDKFKVIYTGAIRPVNDLNFLIDTAEVLKQNYDIQFLIYGDGNQLNSLKETVNEKKLTNIKFKGFINKQNIPYILSKSSINVLNYSQTLYNWSRGNSSNKLFEYIAAGKPIISTVKMGYNIIEEYNIGLVLDNHSPKELAKKILEIKNMKKEQYDTYLQNARKCEKDFDYKELTNKLLEVIEELENENISNGNRLSKQKHA